MDAVIVIADGTATCRKLRDVIEGEQIVCGVHGIRIQPEFKERDRLGFAFMSNDISSERRVQTAARKVAELMLEVKAEGGRIVFVAGPVVIHTGGSSAFREIIRKGFVDALLAGNALAVHDIEHSLYGTSLGVDLDNGVVVEEGHKNHMRAINLISKHGSIGGAVEAGALRSGVMYEIVKNNVPFVLAGSIRDDGPLPDTEMDLIKAQEQYAEAAREHEDGSLPVIDASFDRCREHASVVGKDGLRRYQSRGRDKAFRSRLTADGGYSH